MRVRVFKSSKGWRIVTVDTEPEILGTFKHVVLEGPYFNGKTGYVEGRMLSSFNLAENWKPLSYDGETFRVGRKRLDTYKSVARVAFIGDKTYVSGAV